MSHLNGVASQNVARLRSSHVVCQPGFVRRGVCRIGRDRRRSRSESRGFGSEKVQVGDASREYRLFVPKTVDLSQQAPLVVAFHGMLIDSKRRTPLAGLVPRSHLSDCAACEIAQNRFTRSSSSDHA